MYTNKYEEIKKIFKEFNKAYFNERDVKKTLSFLDDNIFALGISETNIVYNIEEMEIMITEEIKNDPSSYEIDFKYLEVFTISENLFLLICISTLKKEHSVSNSTPINFRTSVIIKETNNEYKFSKIHASIPVETSNLFDFDREIGNIHLNAKHTAFNLLNSSIPGGMIGGYYKENFPLYFLNKHLLDKLEYKSQEEFIKDINGYVINGIHPEDREYVCKIVDSSVKDKDEYEVEYRMKKSNGSYIWVLDRGRLVQTENGPVIVSICLDITEKVYLQENIKTITNNIPGGVYKLKFDEDLTIIYGNDGFYKIHGYSPEEMKVILGNKLIAVTLPEDIPKINAILKNALENNLKNFEYEKRIITKNGEIRYLLTKGVFVKEDGDPGGNACLSDPGNHLRCFLRPVGGRARGDLGAVGNDHIRGFVGSPDGYVTCAHGMYGHPGGGGRDCLAHRIIRYHCDGPDGRIRFFRHGGAGVCRRYRCKPPLRSTALCGL